MEPFNQALETVEKEYRAALAAATTSDALETVRIAFLGRNGRIAHLMEQFRALSTEQKREHGPRLQEIKATATASYEQRKKELATAASHAAQEQHKHFDVTAYTPNQPKGSLHPYTLIVDDINDIFLSMGYRLVDGPEVETEYYNFEALNIPGDHPARDMQDTFWLELPNMLLRTHTSSVQTHVMEKLGPPLAIFTPGRVYRHEQTDASHDCVFMQVEALFIDKDVSLANLLATAKTFLQALFGRDDLKIRVRPGYFPFVEPGVEIDASCPFCAQGCSVCKRTTWIELLGAGLVHPNVLRASSIDPDVYSGFAFGVGIERLAMIKYGINDIRLFHSTNSAFLNQFRD